MKKSIYISLFILAIIFSLNLFAQIDKHVYSCAPTISVPNIDRLDVQTSVLLSDLFNSLAEYGVILTYPESFHIEEMGDIEPNGKQDLRIYIYNNCSSASGVMYEKEIAAMVMDADNGEAAYIYPWVTLPNLKSTRYKPTRELMQDGEYIELELRNNAGDMNLDVRSLLDVHKGNGLREFAGADTAVVYSFDFKRPFLDKYNHCVGLYLRKYGYPPLLFRIALSAEGLKRKDYYINHLLDNIKYSGTPHPVLIECEKASGPKDLDFPTVYHKCHGIIIDKD